MIDGRHNLAFIGLTGCGKTTVSRLVADALGMPWYDCDEEIERAEGLSVDDIFARGGEARFRAAEAERVRALCALRGVVIALGGGAVLHNADVIRANALVVYLRRDARSILSTLDTATRPMLRDDPARLFALERERRAVYEAAAHVIVDNEGGIDDAVQRVLDAVRVYEKTPRPSE